MLITGAGIASIGYILKRLHAARPTTPASLLRSAVITFAAVTRFGVDTKQRHAVSERHWRETIARDPSRRRGAPAAGDHLRERLSMPGTSHRRIAALPLATLLLPALAAAMLAPTSAGPTTAICRAAVPASACVEYRRSPA